ncbi:hypothetical protein AMYBAR_005262 [Amycolatopsis bartoniae]|uniref:Uncharacterized protein n=1 Tax=Amycolatopsis bartoniae TaxID=941986 RepID=A0A8H9J2W1_9PSEU|nr:hypothetical protein [Amycolatopsis bartoniae]TVT11310.1 hypothetical protein FNH07_02640 [Amycolatopsis bartoniae]GHF66527.1 hypothetical protein GCM10017566_45410 [Amycolatopsis bartoniae]
MSTVVLPPCEIALEFEAETLERFSRSWRTARPLQPRAEETIVCETVIDCTETDECASVALCSEEDCTNASCTICA